MDGGAHDGLGAWLIDAAAAAALAGAAGICGVWLDGPGLGMGAATAALIGGLWTLRQIKPEPRRFTVPALVLDDWNGLLIEQAADEDCLELTERVDPDRKVIALPDNVRRMPHALPTPGELQRRIEQHLCSAATTPAEPEARTVTPVVPLAADASAALRSALADLRRVAR